eukprot:TRINITY_DN3262_c0_g1_i1.p1 TRINITY_DN3262_c0_g1~~TRINITY_DN3262_c0_g1_i1.p1  ORF type:complete len:143 (+),score=30.00 TRINITY_DN3262_c0_g1_i1:207-635(+)
MASLRPAIRALAARRSMSTAQVSGVTPASSVQEQIWKPDHAKQNMAIYHKSGMACAVLTPLALAVPNLPCDVVLSVLFPMHAYVGLHACVSDYVPNNLKGAMRGLVLAATGVTMVGMQVVNFKGDGMTRSTLKLWSKPEANK